jgi:hypothetical protein
VRSALYYPYTSIQSETLIRTSLLLWDRVHIMVPWDGFRSDYNDRDHARALELIGVRHVPSDDEKRQAHEIVEDFATRPLPEPFSYASKGAQGDWPVYPEKLLPETWRMLKMTGLAGQRMPNSGVPVTEPTGLSLLSILADCCAGETLARITDRGAAYGVLAGLLVQNPGDGPSPNTAEGLVATTLRIIDSKRVPLTKLIAFREREEKAASGHELRALRHRYLDRLTTQVSALARLPKKSDRAELNRQFNQEMKDDLRHLRSELRLSAVEALASRELLAAVLAGAAAVAAPAFHLPLRDVVSASGGIVSIGGLLALRTKFVKSRHDVLKNHPMAYLYEFKGGLRI